jgi:hypothetical protein
LAGQVRESARIDGAADEEAALLLMARRQPGRIAEQRVGVVKLGEGHATGSIVAAVR